MKNIIVIIVLLSTLFAPRAEAQVKQIELEVSGLTCSLCSRSTHQALRKVSFVKSVDVDLNKNTFLLEIDEKSKLNLDEIRKRVEGAGFTVSMLVAEIDFSQVKSVDDSHYLLGGNVFHFVGTDKLQSVQKVQLINKGFILDKESKTIASSGEIICYEDEEKCVHDMMSKPKPLYHIRTI